MPSLELPDEFLAAGSVAIHFVAEEGLSFYPLSSALRCGQSQRQ